MENNLQIMKVASPFIWVAAFGQQADRENSAARFLPASQEIFLQLLLFFFPSSSLFIIIFYIRPYLSFKPDLMEKDLCICKWQSWKPITGIHWSTVERPSPGLDYWPLELITAPSPGNYPLTILPTLTETHLLSPPRHHPLSYPSSHLEVTCRTASVFYVAGSWLKYTCCLNHPLPAWGSWGGGWQWGYWWWLGRLSRK